MKAIALRSQPRTAIPRSSRRTTVAVRAWAGDNAPWAGLLRFFVSRKELNVKDDVWPENNFKGTISRGRRPFKDGFMGQKLPTKSAVVAQEAQQLLEEQTDTALGYLNEAAERVMKHNFKGEASEPKWRDLGAGSRGWSGEIRNSREQKEKGGFHSKIM